MTEPAKLLRRTRRLDADDPAVRESFERLFYRGFAHVTHNRLIRTLWDWDIPGERLRTRVPYEDQALWGRFTNDRFDAGAAVNVRLNQLQSGAYGFTMPLELAPQAAQGRVCEFMAFFVVDDNSLSGLFAFWNDVFEALRELGFTHTVGTTAPKILPLYRRIGAIPIDEAVIEGETRYFIHFDLSRTSRWMKREASSLAAPELSEPVYLVSPAPAPADALSLVDQELGVQLARLLVVLNIARGESDEGHSLDVRTRCAARIRQLLQKYLAHIAAASKTPEQTAAVVQRERQLVAFDALTESVHGFASLACAHPGRMTDTLVESLDALLLTALRAWDHEEGEQETLVAVTREDRAPMLAKLRENARGEALGAPSEAVLVELGDHFAQAVRVLHRLFGSDTL